MNTPSFEKGIVLSRTDLQSTEAARAVDSLFDTHPTAVATLKSTLEVIGAFTLADVLAMGLDGMRRSASETPFAPRIGPKRVDQLRSIIEHIGWILPDAPAGVAELPRYYQDIRAASPAIALPTTHYNIYRDFGFAAPYTIGRLLDTADLPATFARFEDNQERLRQFAEERLVPLVAEFDAQIAGQDL